MAALLVGIWPDAQHSPAWPEIEALLRPAAERGGVAIEHGPGWHVWTVHRDGRLIAAANVRRTLDQAVEVVLVGGRGFRQWLGPLDARIGEWARDEGATRLRAYGRRGWARVLGWRVIGRERGVTGYERVLQTSAPPFQGGVGVGARVCAPKKTHRRCAEQRRRGHRAPVAATPPQPLP